MGFVTALPVAAQLLISASAGPPEFNVEPTCRAVAARAMSGSPAKACLRSEKDARQQLKEQWSQFTAGDRSRCLSLSTMGGIPSYVELLTCLEISRAARGLPDDGLRSTTGRGSPGAVR